MCIRDSAYATPGSAAADLCAVLDEPLTLAPMERALVPTGLAIELPGAHSVALVYARSGLSIKHGLCTVMLLIACGCVCESSNCSASSIFRISLLNALSVRRAAMHVLRPVSYTHLVHSLRTRN